MSQRRGEGLIAPDGLVNSSNGDSLTAAAVSVVVIAITHYGDRPPPRSAMLSRVSYQGHQRYALHRELTVLSIGDENITTMRLWCSFGG
ncbi:hypothetical protein J6590_033688 [Homalodisca vitripennis]|nr:hypothetical protein J6590_033688 [Homalodisca vitripennis]